MLFGMDLNIYAFVGVIMLVGSSRKNAIMMIDFAWQPSAPKASARRRFTPGPGPVPAHHDDHHGGPYGSLPSPWASGGAESRQPLGVAVVGGLLVSQLLTL